MIRDNNSFFIRILSTFPQPSVIWIPVLDVFTEGSQMNFFVSSCLCGLLFCCSVSVRVLVSFVLVVIITLFFSTYKRISPFLSHSPIYLSKCKIPLCVMIVDECERVSMDSSFAAFMFSLRFRNLIQPSTFFGCSVFVVGVRLVLKQTKKKNKKKERRELVQIIKSREYYNRFAMRRVAARAWLIDTFRLKFMFIEIVRLYFSVWRFSVCKKISRKRIGMFATSIDLAESNAKE